MKHIGKWDCMHVWKVEYLLFSLFFLYRLFIHYLCPSFSMNKNVEWARVLPSSFIIHNLGLNVNSSLRLPKKALLIWSCPVTSQGPLWQLCFFLLTTIQSKFLYSPQSLWASNQRQAAGLGVGNWTEIEELSQRECPPLGTEWRLELACGSARSFGVKCHTDETNSLSTIYKSGQLTVGLELTH